MPHTIQLAAELAAAPAEIYDAYLDKRIHAAITGAAVTIAPKAGARFSAFDGAIWGCILQVEPKRLIVQSWRSTQWRTADVDSTLILSLLPLGRAKTLVELTQVNVPVQDFAGVSRGWELYYWAPWRAYLEQRRSAKKAPAVT